jgi:hypothetical protein
MTSDENIPPLPDRGEKCRSVVNANFTSQERPVDIVLHIGFSLSIVSNLGN